MSKPDSQPSRPPASREFIHTLLLAALIAFVFRTFAFEPFTIPSSSMEPGLLIGDFLFVSKYSYGYSSLTTTHNLLPFRGRLFAKDPQRGDVVVFKLPEDGKTDYIKRVVGLPGDTIRVIDGVLYVNGESVTRTPLETPVAWEWLTPPPDSRDYRETFPVGKKQRGSDGQGASQDQPKSHVIRELGDDYRLDNTEVFTVPAGHFFAMGDNRDNSADSRTVKVGMIPFENLEGKAQVVAFSLADNTKYWQVWKWPSALRKGRFWKKID